MDFKKPTIEVSIECPICGHFNKPIAKSIVDGDAEILCEECGADMFETEEDRNRFRERGKMIQEMVDKMAIEQALPEFKPPWEE